MNEVKLEALKKKGIFLVLLSLTLLFFPITICYNKVSAEEDPSLSKIHAPEFPKDVDWLNTSHPLTLAALREKIILLDFWTYCCINCIHVLPKLHDLELKYGDNLVVIGVHSAKFRDEGETHNIRDAILRYEIKHPVINDRDFRVWKEYDARAWPTMVLIDPDGYIVGTKSGESGPEYFDPMIQRLVDEYSTAGKLDSTPLNLTLEEDNRPKSLLSYPGKVHVDDKNNKLFISDSNHNRILQVSLPDGTVEAVIGNGKVGIDDGSYDQATFNHPQGIFRHKDYLYVADTENHALRRLDLKKKIVTTIAGTGEQAQFRAKGGNALTTALNSPWDVLWEEEKLFIAMAGPHQIWYYEPGNDIVGVYAGSGREDIIDGQADEAALAQPSGLATDGKLMYFADSEVSAIRTVSLEKKPKVKTIVGMGLFKFGDEDGVGSTVRLQHPLGVTYLEGDLYVADTYNNKIKKIEIKKFKSTTYAGNGSDGVTDGDRLRSTFDEPGGLDASQDGKIYIADTNNHLIRVLDTTNDKVSTLVLKGFKEKMPESEMPDIPQYSIPKWSMKSGAGSIQVKLYLPEEFKLNKEGGVYLTVTNDPQQLLQLDNSTFSATDKEFNVPVNWLQGDGYVDFALEFYYCRESNEGLCFFDTQTFRLPLSISSAAETSTFLLENRQVMIPSDSN
ncbi:redoxin domain-containing protein [bacterium]|nr:redoxin domain-containing protein [bacterium]